MSPPARKPATAPISEPGALALRDSAPRKKMPSDGPPNSPWMTKMESISV